MFGHGPEVSSMRITHGSDAVLQGLGSGGTAFNTHRWRELGYLLTMSKSVQKA